MKTFITIVTTAIVTTVISGLLISSAFENYYKEYNQATDTLLHLLEETDESNGIIWDDVVCETDAWSNFIDAREKVGLGYLEYYNKQGE